MRHITRRSDSNPEVWDDVRALRVEPNADGYFDVYGPDPKTHHKVSASNGHCDCGRKPRCSHLDAVNVLAKRILEAQPSNTAAHFIKQIEMALHQVKEGAITEKEFVNRIFSDANDATDSDWYNDGPLPQPKPRGNNGRQRHRNQVNR